MNAKVNWIPSNSYNKHRIAQSGIANEFCTFDSIGKIDLDLEFRGQNFFFSLRCILLVTKVPQIAIVVIFLKNGKEGFSIVRHVHVTFIFRIITVDSFII